MGGPWRAKGFDAMSWRPPAPHWDAEVMGPGPKRETGIVLAYIGSVLVGLAIMLVLAKNGWW